MDDMERVINEKAQQLVEKKPFENAPTEALSEEDYNEKAKKIVGALATKKAVEDELLVKSITDSKKEELLHNASADLKKEQAESKKADIALQQADYGVNSGVAAYAGIKKPLPSKMQSILFTTLSVFQLIFLILIGLPISLVNIIADSVDAVVSKLGAVTKSARWVVIGVLIVGGIIVVVYVIKFLIHRFGILA